VCRRFERELAVVRAALSQRELLPSQRLVAEEVLELIGADIQAIGQVATAGERRVLAEEPVPAAKRCSASAMGMRPSL